ncbi:MAG: hypothetical protein ACJ8AT_02355 [Hyalangium sp.]|uniref:hypothetical protein n=1 Tax=Hyalangium sp. TaxID=2028555 RepID=UPI00389A868A
MKLFEARPSHHAMVLVFWGLLAGCASGGAGPRLHPVASFTPPSSGRPVGAARQRTLLASSDGVTPSGEAAGQKVQGYSVPGRKPDSQAPWEFFLGNAAHRLIAYMYGVNHPTSRVFYNTKTIVDILQDRRIGDPSRLLPNERSICPDITDVSIWKLFEIKPWNTKGLQEGLQEAQIYLAALNRALLVGKAFTLGTGFEGQILIRFARGQYIWRLEWQTTEPGVVQYRWTRSQQRFDSAAAASDAAQWVALTEEEMRQYGGWVGQAVEGMVNRREQLASFSGAVGVVIDIMGEGAKALFTGVILDRMNSGAGTQPPGQPPAQGGQVIPFPVQPIPSAPPAQVPAAAMGM